MHNVIWRSPLISGGCSKSDVEALLTCYYGHKFRSSHETLVDHSLFACTSHDLNHSYNVMVASVQVFVWRTSWNWEGQRQQLCDKS